MSGSRSEWGGSGAARELVRVLVVHDHPVLRRGLVVTLEDDPRLRVVGQAAGLDAARCLQEDARADVVLVDEGLWCERAEELDPARVLVLTTSQRPAGIGAILSSGAAGCVNLAGDPATLREAVHVVAAGGRYLADGVHDPVVRIDDDPEPGAPPGLPAGYGVTPAELRVLAELVHGLTNAQIADELHVSENTVKTHLGSIFRKLEVSHRSEATAVAIREGLVS